MVFQTPLLNKLNQSFTESMLYVIYLAVLQLQKSEISLVSIL